MTIVLSCQFVVLTVSTHIYMVSVSLVPGAKEERLVHTDVLPVN